MRTQESTGSRAAKYGCEQTAHEEWPRLRLRVKAWCSFAEDIRGHMASGMCRHLTAPVGAVGPAGPASWRKHAILYHVCNGPEV